jgi:Cu+-exporting ATPase
MVEHAPTDSPTRTELAVSGLTCNNCARKVTGIVQAFPGVAGVSVSLEQSRASVRWQPGTAPDVAGLLQQLEQAGYASRVLTDSATPPVSRLGGWGVNLLLGVPVTLLLMAGEWIFRLGEARWFGWAGFLLGGVVQVFCGAKFYRGAWAQLKARSANMDTLVALGSTAAFGYSAWALLAGWPGHLYFMEAAAILTLISVGHWIEARVGARAAGALRSLMELAPATARRLVPLPPPSRSTGKAFDLLSSSFQPGLAAGSAVAPVEEEVPVARLRVGDRVVLRPGDRVPVDGEVIEGASAVNEAMLTGESLPVEKTPGQPLYAGTVNLNGRLVMRVTATGDATALAHIIAAVQRAQNSRADIQRLGDRISSVFVPVVCVIALLTAAWWGLAYEHAVHVTGWLGQFLWHPHPPGSPVAAAVIAAAAVLIVACPCAMGLATPAAIMAAANAAARRGILIRDGVALEKAGRVSAVLFDKTGTLTTGELALAGSWQPDGSTLAGNAANDLAAALARHSKHPVSRVIAALSEAAARLENWREVAASGVQADWCAPDGSVRPVRLGSVAWMTETGVGIPTGEPQLQQWQTEGASLVGLAAGGELVAVYAVRDTLKPGVPAVVDDLRRQGLRVFLVTGDQPTTAQAIARAAGIPAENVFAGVRPERKGALVKELQSRGERVAFVGDGINDAPALEQADLGIAVSRASDVAREAADLILLRSEIGAVPESLGLARAALRTIKQNLFWAFFYNVSFIPLAALGFMSPVLCAIAMGASDLIVIGNALRLLRWRHAVPAGTMAMSAK